MQDGYVEQNDKQVTAFVGKDGINIARMRTILSGLKLETHGIRVHRGVSCLAICRKEYGLKAKNAEQMIPKFQAVYDAEVKRMMENGQIITK